MIPVPASSHMSLLILVASAVISPVRWAFRGSWNISRPKEEFFFTLAAEMEYATLTLDTLARCDSKTPIKTHQSPYKGSYFQQNNRCTDGLESQQCLRQNYRREFPCRPMRCRIQYTRVKPICITTVPHAFVKYTTAPHQDKTRNITWCFDTRRYRYGLNTV